MNLAFSKSLSRRTFLKGAGVCLALPYLEAMTPAFAKVRPSASPKRFVAVGNSFGMYPPAFFPTASGANYEFPELLAPLQPLKSDFTIFSGLDHGLTGGHFGVHSYLSGVLSVDAKNMPEGNISLDQRIAESLGQETRFPSLTVGSDSGLHNGCQMSWTRSGVRVPPITDPRELFNILFVEDTEEGKRAAAKRMALKTSILDSVREDAENLTRKVGKRDREKLDEYYTAVRDAERTVEQNSQWIHISKPKAPIEAPQFNGIVEDLPILYELVALALETDSTRIATIEISSEDFDTAALGVSGGYHSISHHGKRPEKIRDLITLEKYQTQQFSRFLDRLRRAQSTENGESLLSDSIVLFGSGMGNGNSHTNTNLPIIVAGGGFRHGQHISFLEEGRRHAPLSNLYLSIMNRMGIDSNAFAMSTGTLPYLETA
jgi:hypothetical protein